MMSFNFRSLFLAFCIIYSIYAEVFVGQKIVNNEIYTVSLNKLVFTKDSTPVFSVETSICWKYVDIERGDDDTILILSYNASLCRLKMQKLKQGLYVDSLILENFVYRKSKMPSQLHIKSSHEILIEDDYGLETIDIMSNKVVDKIFWNRNNHQPVFKTKLLQTTKNNKYACFVQEGFKDYIVLIQDNDISYRECGSFVKANDLYNPFVYFALSEDGERLIVQFSELNTKNVPIIKIYNFETLELINSVIVPKEIILHSYLNGEGFFHDLDPHKDTKSLFKTLYIGK